MAITVDRDIASRIHETSGRLTDSPHSRFETVNTIQSGMDCRERRLRMKVNINVVSPSLTLTRRQPSTCAIVIVSINTSVSHGWAAQLMRASACHLFNINRGMRISVPRLLRRESRRGNCHMSRKQSGFHGPKSSELITSQNIRLLAQKGGVHLIPKKKTQLKVF